MWVPESKPAYLACFDALSSEYLRGADWEQAELLEQRAASLLPGLLLARVDGKSPAEYLTQDSQKNFVRAFATRFLQSPPSRLAEIRDAWQKS
jgi:hypothetical protein